MRNLFWITISIVLVTFGSSQATPPTIPKAIEGFCEPLGTFGTGIPWEFLCKVRLNPKFYPDSTTRKFAEIRVNFVFSQDSTRITDTAQLYLGNEVLDLKQYYEFSFTTPPPPPTIRASWQ